MSETNGHGGARNGAGRKSRAEEQKLIERLSPMDDIALALLQEGLVNKDLQCLKLFMEYRFGKPKQTIDASLEGGLDIIWNEQRTYETK